MLSATRTLLRVLNILNWVVGAALLAVAVASLVAAGPLGARLAGDLPTGVAGAEALLWWLRAVGLIALVIVPAAHVILTRLIAMVDAARARESFTLENVARLRTIAWALLVINVADLFFGAASMLASEASGERLDWSPSLTGWLAVVLLFALARIFGEGAAMREELEGTV